MHRVELKEVDMIKNYTYCRKIADYIIKNNNNKYASLLYGNAGICVFLYHLSKVLNLDYVEKYADELLSDMSQNKFVLPSPDFENGLAGTGWFVEYLIQNGFSEGDTDKILGDIDQEVFKFLNESENIPLCLNNGLLGYLLFMMNRLEGKEKIRTDQTLVHQELFCDIIDRIFFLAPSQLPGMNLDLEFDLFWHYPLLLLCLAKAFDLDVYNEKIEPMYKDWLLYLLSVLPGLHAHRIYLAYALSEMNKRIKIKSVDDHIRTLLFSVDSGTLKNEINSYADNIRYGWLGIVLILKKMDENLSDIENDFFQIRTCRREIVDMYKPCLLKRIDELYEKEKDNAMKPQQYGIALGWAGIGLLLVLYPDILDV